MKRNRAVDCQCCGLRHKVLMDDNDNSHLTHCTTCQGHRYSNSALQRDTDHKAMWQEYLRELNAELDEAYARMKSAYRTRATALDALGRVNDIHDLRPNGQCTCGKKGKCQVAEILADRFVSQLIRANDAARARELRRRQFDGDWYDEWDGVIDETVVNPVQQTPIEPNVADTA